MLLNNCVKLGSGIVKISIATVKIAAPLASKAASSTVSFTRREIALGKQEASVQSALIKSDYAKMKESTAKAKVNIMAAFSADLFPEETEVAVS